MKPSMTETSGGYDVRQEQFNGGGADGGGRAGGGDNDGGDGGEKTT